MWGRFQLGILRQKEKPPGGASCVVLSCRYTKIVNYPLEPVKRYCVNPLLFLSAETLVATKEINAKLLVS